MRNRRAPNLFLKENFKRNNPQILTLTGRNSRQARKNNEEGNLDVRITAYPTTSFIQSSGNLRQKPLSVGGTRVLYLNLRHLGEEGRLGKGVEDADVEMVCLISPAKEEKVDMTGRCWGLLERLVS